MLFIFDHIFKTAGTTFNLSYLPGAFEPEDLFVLHGMRDTNQQDLERAAAFDDETRRRLKVIAGHNAGRLRESYPQAGFLTLVRDPTERGISGYLHSKFHGDAYEPVGREIQEQNIPLAEFIERDLFAARYAEFVSFHEWQARTVLGEESFRTTPWTEQAALEVIQSRFHLVGYTEAFEKFVFYLHVTEGWPLVLFNRRLVREERATFECSEADLAAVNKHSQLDALLYRCARSEFERKFAEIWNPETAEEFTDYCEALRKFSLETDRNPFVSPRRHVRSESVSQPGQQAQ